MAFIDVIRDVLAELGMSTGDFEALTGLSSNNFQSWATRPGIRPRRTTLETIEKALGIRFKYGRGVRNVVGWERPGDTLASQKEEVTMKDDTVSDDRTADVLLDRFAGDLRNLVAEVRLNYQPSTAQGDRMQETSSEFYNVKYRTLVRKLEVIRKEAEVKMESLILEFENEIDQKRLEDDENEK